MAAGITGIDYPKAKTPSIKPANESNMNLDNMGTDQLAQVLTDMMGKQDPTDGSPIDRQQVYSRFSDRMAKAKNVKNIQVTEWNKYLRQYEGYQWDDDKRPNYRISSTDNIVFPLVEAQVALMTDKEPTVTALPQAEGDEDLAKKVNNTFTFVWNTSGMDEKYVQLSRNAHLYGTSILKPFWDEEKWGGLGDCNFMVCDPYDILVPPEASEAEQLEWIIHRVRMPKRIVNKRFEKGYMVATDSQYMTENGREDELKMASTYSDDMCTVYEYWEYDDEGNVMVGFYSNGMDLEYGYSPYEENRFPFIWFYNYKLPSRLWGISECKLLEPIQREKNKLRSVILENILMNTFSPIIMDKQSGVERNQMYQRAGQIIVRNAGAKIERLQMPSMPSDVFHHDDNIKNSAEYITGINPVAFGVAPGSVSAYSALSLLTEGAQARVRGKLRNMEYGIVEIGRWILSLIRQFYTEKRFVRINSDLYGYRFDTFAAAQELRIPEQTDAQGNVIKERLIDFDIQIEAGSSMRVSKAARFQQALDMYQKGLIDKQTVIRLSGIGDPKTIMKAMEQEQLQQAQIQMQIEQLKTQMAQMAQMQAAQAQPNVQAQVPPAVAG